MIPPCIQPGFFFHGSPPLPAKEFFPVQRWFILASHKFNFPAPALQLKYIERHNKRMPTLRQCMTSIHRVRDNILSISWVNAADLIFLSSNGSEAGCIVPMLRGKLSLSLRIVSMDAGSHGSIKNRSRVCNGLLTLMDRASSMREDH
ncbi:MAG: hypothetical protein ACE5E9_06540 [Nitrospinaceae bacterium]